MARITTRDCERFVPDRFELVLLAAERAHHIARGAASDLVGEAPTVAALREIAAGRVSPEDLRSALFRRVLGLPEPDRPDEATRPQPAGEIMLPNPAPSGRPQQDSAVFATAHEFPDPPPPGAGRSGRERPVRGEWSNLAL